MKKYNSPIVLLSFACFSIALQASDQKHKRDITDITLFGKDRNMFQLEDLKLTCLYLRSFIYSIHSRTTSAIEKNVVLTVCETANKETNRLQAYWENKSIPWEAWKHLNRWRKRIYNRSTALHNTFADIVTIPDQDLLLYLRFAVQSIKRVDGTMEITFFNGTQAAFAKTDSLAQFMEKYREHENKDIVA